MSERMQKFRAWICRRFGHKPHYCGDGSMHCARCGVQYIGSPESIQDFWRNIANGP